MFLYNCVLVFVGAQRRLDAARYRQDTTQAGERFHGLRDDLAEEGAGGVFGARRGLW